MPQWLSFTTRVPNFCIVWIFCKIWSETDHRHMTCLDFDHPTWVNTRCYYATPDVSVKVWSEIKILLTSALSKHSTLPLQRWNQISVTCALKMPFFASFFFFCTEPLSATGMLYLRLLVWHTGLRGGISSGPRLPSRFDFFYSHEHAVVCYWGITWKYNRVLVAVIG